MKQNKNVASVEANETNDANTTATGYVVRILQVRLEDGSEEEFYIGTDGYCWSSPDYAEPYKRRGNAERYISKDIDDTARLYNDSKKVGNNAVILNGCWLSVYTIETVNIK